MWSPDQTQSVSRYLVCQFGHQISPVLVFRVHSEEDSTWISSGLSIAETPASSRANAVPTNWKCIVNIVLLRMFGSPICTIIKRNWEVICRKMKYLAQCIQQAVGNSWTLIGAQTKSADLASCASKLPYWAVANNSGRNARHDSKTERVDM